MDLTQKFFDLFKGLENAHGSYAIDSAEESGKQKGLALTLKKPITLDLWNKHLKGELGLGVIPIREDSTCLWGALDIDDYTINHKDFISKQLKKIEVPFLPCRTKSGGLHLYIFFKDPIPADKLVPKLKDIAASLGYGTCEVFPKQIVLRVDRGDVGNWLICHILEMNHLPDIAMTKPEIT